MADMNDDMDDGKQELEAMNSRQEQNKEIDALGFDAEKMEAIESEFKDFLNEHLKGKDLEKFKHEYNKINKALKTSYDGEKKLIKKGKELISQIYDKTSNYRAALRMANNDIEKITNMKADVNTCMDDVQIQHGEEDKIKEQIQTVKLEINNLRKEQQQACDVPEDKILKDLMAQYDELYKSKEEQDERIDNMKFKNRELQENQKKIEEEIFTMTDNIDKVNDMIKETEQKTKDKELQKKDLEDDTSGLRGEIIKQKKVVEEKQDEYKKAKEENKNEKETIAEKQGKIQALKEAVGAQEKELHETQGYCNEQKTSHKHQEEQLIEKREKLELIKADQLVLEKDHAYKHKKLQIVTKKQNESTILKIDNEKRKIEVKTQLDELTKKYELKKKEVDDDRKEIDSKMRQRDLLNKDVVTAEEDERRKFSIIQTLTNELKKLQNKIQGYKHEALNLQKLIHQLEKDKQKYGIEASQANAKYYQCLEQVKLKNNLITKLQKKNIEAEGRLKQQQTLYEAVRSDRNLYSKNLLEAQEEIAELKMKFRRMTQQISHLKEEIGSKDQAIISEEELQKNYSQQNQTLQTDIAKITRNIKSSEEMIKTQESDIARLKYVISEAESEKQKQRKDYEMVINERDILGTQLIKRNEELALLYEKIKIQKSTLKKGEIYYQERLNDIINIRKHISDLKRQLNVSQNETSCIPDLKREIYLLQKEYLEQQQKAKYLSDELEKPFNVHRWRKLECTDPETYEMIQKIQSLQKRLISKTEEVSEKDVLIQEKEKLYIELKNILAKQSGPEVAEKLQVYQQNLKERTQQLKEMVKELKNYQSQVQAYKFEIERLDKQVGSVKELYFNSKQNQVIYEDMEGEQMEEMDDAHYQQYQQDIGLQQQQQYERPNGVEVPPSEAQM